jgi:hypothetical protein
MFHTGIARELRGSPPTRRSRQATCHVRGVTFVQIEERISERMIASTVILRLHLL